MFRLPLGVGRHRQHGMATLAGRCRSAALVSTAAWGAALVSALALLTLVDAQLTMRYTRFHEEHEEHLMLKATVDLTMAQAEQLLEQASPQMKIRLVRRWEQETWPTRFRALLRRIDRRLKKQPHLARQLMKTVGPARRAFHPARGAQCHRVS